MLQHKDQRVGVFVDVANMYYSARNLFGARANFGEILTEAVGTRRLIRAIAYVVKAEAPEEVKFFDALGKQGFEIKSKDLQVFAGGAKKGDWDVGLAIDAISMAPKIDAVVLVTGDGDFVPLVQYLQFLGLRVEVMAFAESVSQKLKDQVDGFVDLSADRDRFTIRSKIANDTRVRARSQARRFSR